METSNIYFLDLIPENNEVLITYRAGDVDTISYEDFNTLGLTDSFIELTTEHLEAKEVKQLLELNKEVNILNMYGTNTKQEGNKMIDLYIEFQAMDRMPIFEIEHREEYYIYNIVADTVGIHTTSGLQLLQIEWDDTFSLDEHLESLYELCHNDICEQHDEMIERELY